MGAEFPVTTGVQEKKPWLVKKTKHRVTSERARMRELGSSDPVLCYAAGELPPRPAQTWRLGTEETQRTRGMLTFQLLRDLPAVLTDTPFLFCLS